MKMRSWLIVPGLAVGLCTLAAGCDDKPPPNPAETADAGPAQPVLDQDLQAAMEAASATPPASKGASAPDGPPTSGIFDPGQAEKILAKGAPAKIELLSEGAEPRVTIARAAAGAKQKAMLTVGARMAGSPMPTLEYALSLEAPKPKDEADPLTVLIKVGSVTLAKEQRGQVPAELEKQFGKLKGMEVRYDLEPSGAGRNFAYTLPKGSEGLDTLVRSMVETLSSLVIAAPEKPVGVGAYWMVTDWATAIGADVLRYRVFRVEAIDGNIATLSIDLRKYAANAKVELPLGAKPVAVDLSQFESKGKGKTMSQGSLLADMAEINDGMALRIAMGNQQQVAQNEGTATLAGQKASKELVRRRCEAHGLWAESRY